MNLTTNHIRQIVGSGGKANLIKAFVDTLNERGAEFGIKNYLRLCHFVSQCAHESAHFKTFEEYASGAAYEGRRDLGNIHPGDGKRYKGRGCIQITGRSNYARYGRIIGVDVENHPERAEDPSVGVLLSLAYWQDRGLSKFADADNVKVVTKRINGGYNGLADRVQYLKKAKAVLKNIDFSAKTVEADEFPLKRGSRGQKVKDLQEVLKAMGYSIDPDGIFGPATERTVRELQEDLEMDVTGQVDDVTWDVLMEPEEE